MWFKASTDASDWMQEQEMGKAGISLVLQREQRTQGTLYCIGPCTLHGVSKSATQKWEGNCIVS